MQVKHLLKTIDDNTLCYFYQNDETYFLCSNRAKDTPKELLRCTIRKIAFAQANTEPCLSIRISRDTIRMHTDVLGECMIKISRNYNLRITVDTIDEEMIILLFHKKDFVCNTNDIEPHSFVGSASVTDVRRYARKALSKYLRDKKEQEKTNNLAITDSN